MSDTGGAGSKPLQIGSVLAGCRLDAIAGRGGMGTVYRAYQLALDRVVALKVINPELGANAEFKDRFRREARLAAAIDHAHVVPVLHAGEESGYVFLVMRYIEGTDLAAILRRSGPLPAADVVSVGAQIGAALDAAHARGLVHRDVKPANILITGESGAMHCYLTDFGITKDAADHGLTQTGVALGTVDYMAPEQITSGHVDGRADLYSLGCVLFQALTGRVPYPADTQPARLIAHLQAPVQDPRALRPELDPRVARAVMRCLAKDPAERPVSGAELARALDGTTAMSGAGAANGAAGSTERSSYKPGSTAVPTDIAPDQPHDRMAGAPRRRAVLLGAGALVLVGGTAVGLALTRRGGASSAATTSSPTVTRTTGTTRGPSTATSGITTTGPAAGWVAGSPFKVAAGPVDLVVSSETLWTANSSGASVSSVDPTNGQVSTVGVGGVPAQIAFGQGTAWCWNYSNSITPIDPITHSAKELVRTGGGTFGEIAAGSNYLWFTIPDEGAIGRIDMRSAAHVPGTINVGGRPSSISVFDGTVYVLLAATDKLVTVSESTGKVTGQSISVPAGMQGVSAVQDHLWVVGPGTIVEIKDRVPRGAISLSGSGVLMTPDNVWMLDARNNRILRYSADGRTQQGSPINGIGENASDMEFGNGSLWVLDKVAATVTRVQPG